LEDFSSYVAVDELYEGALCILSAVDNGRYKRLLYEVLDYNPTPDDIRGFLSRLKTVLDARDLILEGITTHGSPLYPVPIVNENSPLQHYRLGVGSLLRACKK
jgi:hypothetical protein